jgi:acyl-CoA synthetase (AMP-forming)/AMP-acid ligase II
VQIRDRLKDETISGGANISSVEVEAMLVRHPSVMEAAAVGLPDQRWQAKRVNFTRGMSTIARSATVDLFSRVTYGWQAKRTLSRRSA